MAIYGPSEEQKMNNYMTAIKYNLLKEFQVLDVIVFRDQIRNEVIIKFKYKNKYYVVKSSSDRYEVIRGIVRKYIEGVKLKQIQSKKRERRRLQRIKKVRAIIALRREKKKDKRTNMKNFRRIWKTRIINSSPYKSIKPIFSGFMNMPPGYLPNPSD